MELTYSSDQVPPINRQSSAPGGLAGMQLGGQDAHYLTPNSNGIGMQRPNNFGTYIFFKINI